MLPPDKRRKAAAKFAKDWQGRGDEKSDTQSFWLTLLTKVFGVPDAEGFIQFETRTKLNHKSFIDAIIPSTEVLIEQKSANKNLRKPIRQSDGSELTPYLQAKRYADSLPNSERPRWIVCCNFREFHIHDLEHPHDEPQVVLLENLPSEINRLGFIVDTKTDHTNLQAEVSLKAGELVGQLYNELIAQYIDPDSEETLASLNRLCVCLVFLLYAEDAGVFKPDAFHDYLAPYASQPSDARNALLRLFKILDTPTAERDPYIDEDLASFPYVNGALFYGADRIIIPRLTPRFIEILLTRASLDFDWSAISPTIFGSLFESTLNPETRRHGGMHYTSVQNIHRLIDPLFLDKLTAELDDIIADKSATFRNRNRRLDAYRDRLAALTFLDPACGSGNFLTETYLSLRRLENRALRAMLSGQKLLDLGEEFSPVKVNINQFYGIEINDFAVAVAKTALWIAESQMLRETEDILDTDIDFLPLRSYNNIIHANALTTDWNDIIPSQRLRYIVGNPPFVGARNMEAEQKKNLEDVFGKGWRGVGNLDFVSAWYKRASNYMRNTTIHAAFVSTNSICQGEQAAALWKRLLADGLLINFARRTFRWDSESNSKAHVHCIIVGFSHIDNPGKKVIYDGEAAIAAKNINPYLVDAPDIIVESRQHPINDVPEIGIGNQPIDGGNYLFTREEMEAFIKHEPQASDLFHPFYGAQEFINRAPRYCLWLGDTAPNRLRQLPECRKRIEAVRKFRLASTRKPTLKLADRPTRFQVENMPNCNYLVIPAQSSERRDYIPIGFMSSEALCSNALFLMPDSTFYHFGILTSSVHMAWIRAVCGRLKSDYRYSKDVVYNNFPWPDCGDKQREAIAKAGQEILDTRDKYPSSSLADLYDPLTMPYDLRMAHISCDQTVLRAYGLPKDAPESRIVAHLLNKMLERLND